jgi:hypothetical protein
MMAVRSPASVDLSALFQYMAECNTGRGRAYLFGARSLN